MKIANSEIVADVVFVEDQAIINVVDRKIKYKSLEWLGTFKKLSDKQLVVGLDNLIHNFERQGIKITYLHLDDKFKFLQRKGEKRWGLKINLSSLDEHVPDARRNNQTLQDCVRVLYHRLPFKFLPRTMIGHACITQSSIQNAFHKQNGISTHFAPETIINKKMLVW